MLCLFCFCLLPSWRFLTFFHSCSIFLVTNATASFVILKSMNSQKSCKPCRVQLCLISAPASKRFVTTSFAFLWNRSQQDPIFPLHYNLSSSKLFKLFLVSGLCFLLFESISMPASESTADMLVSLPKCRVYG